MSTPVLESSKTAASVSKTAQGDGKKSKKPSSVASALSGAMSGAVVSAMTQPLDVVRTKMQADAAQGVVRSTLGTAGAILSTQGPRGLWAGTAPSVIRVGLGAGMHFVLLEQVRALLSTVASDGSHQLSNAGAAMAGGLSRAVAAVLLCPVTVVKTRMEYVAEAPPPASAGGAGASSGVRATAAAAGAGAAAASSAPRYRDVGHALGSILRAEGVGGLFRGVVPTVLANAPYSGLYYMFYRRLQEALAREDRPQFAVNFASGVAAAFAATLLTQPADVVRTRMQLNLGTGAVAAAGGAAAVRGPGGALAASLGAWGTMAAALRNEGPAALMTGVTPRLLKRTLQTALVWTLYEDLVPRITQLGLAARQAWEERSKSGGKD